MGEVQTARLRLCGLLGRRGRLEQVVHLLVERLDLGLELRGLGQLPPVQHVPNRNGGLNPLLQELLLERRQLLNLRCEVRSLERAGGEIQAAQRRLLALELLIEGRRGLAFAPWST